MVLILRLWTPIEQKSRLHHRLHSVEIIIAQVPYCHARFLALATALNDIVHGALNDQGVVDVFHSSVPFCAPLFLLLG